jgi:hypothetical protein
MIETDGPSFVGLAGSAPILVLLPTFPAGCLSLLQFWQSPPAAPLTIPLDVAALLAIAPVLPHVLFVALPPEVNSNSARPTCPFRYLLGEW